MYMKWIVDYIMITSFFYLEPLVDGILHFDESLLPSFDASLKWLNEGGAPHCLCLNNLVIKVGLYLVNGSQDWHSWEMKAERERERERRWVWEKIIM